MDKSAKRDYGMAMNFRAINWQTLLFLILLALSATSNAGQSAADMQSQMDAANAQQSAVTAPGRQTPLQSFQTYYNYWKGSDIKQMYGCYTGGLQVQKREGQTTPTDSEFIQISGVLSQRGFKNFSLISFVFIANANSPKITAIITYSDPQNQSYKEQLDLTFADTSTGWKIDSESTQELN